MIRRGLNFWKNLGSRVKQHLKQWTKPVTTTLVTETLSDTTRSRVDLIAENAMLRQQLISLRRQIKRPQLTWADRIRLVLLARCTRFWKQALHIVQPETLLRWHRDLFRLHWRRKSRNKKPKPRIAPETITLANAHCERFIGSFKRECLDHMLILHRQQLHRLITEFVDYYNHSRPHQGIGQRIPARFGQDCHPQSGKIASIPVLGGLHHSYTCVANLN